MLSIYVLDTCVFVNLDAHLPIRSVPAAWRLIENTAKAGRLLVPEDVVIEIENEETLEWIRGREEFLVAEVGQLQSDCLVEIAEFIGSQFIDHEKTKPDADQPLVALAMAINHEHVGACSDGPATVVTGEKRSKQGSHRLKIPDACDFFGVRTITFNDFLEIEGPIT